MADYTSLYEEQIQARQNIGRTKSDLAASTDQKSILMYTELLAEQERTLTSIDNHLQGMEEDNPALIPGAGWSQGLAVTNRITNHTNPFS